MSGIIVLLFLFAVEIGYSCYAVVTGKAVKQLKNYVNLIELLLLFLFMLTGIMPFGFRWGMLFVVLLIRGIVSLISTLRWKKGKWTEKEKSLGKQIGRCLLNLVLVGFACIPAFIFADFKAIPTDGSHPFESLSYTWTDSDRIETLDESGENRKVTVQFWYPTDAAGDEKYPLVIFSHGAYGFRGSNQSLCEELASNGYVVCSIDHTYHAIFSAQEDGKIVTINPQFLKEVSMTNSPEIDEEESLRITDGWLLVRTGDMNFVLDQIIEKSNGSLTEADNPALYQHIDTTKIALTGHSLGGATAAEVGRNRDDISAVVDIDGTMMGDIVSAKGEETVLDTTPYPIPLLNIYGQYHYEGSRPLGEDYPNILATETGMDSMETVILGAQHLNYTDLPLFAPGIAKMMGTQGVGDVDTRACIQKLDEIILNYCNHYLKGSENLMIEKEISLK